MIQISLSEASRILLTASRPFYSGLMNITEDMARAYLTFYQTDGVVVLVNSLSQNEHIIDLCDTGVSGGEIDSVMCAAVAEVKCEFDNPMITCRFIGELPPSFTGEGQISLAGVLGDYRDEAVRPLTKEECAVADGIFDEWEKTDDSPFAESIIRCLKYDAKTLAEGDIDVKMLGLFDGGELAGAASVLYYTVTDCVYVDNIYVAPSFRGRGYAPRLIKSVAAEYPDSICCYNADLKNAASINSALKAGMTVSGRKVWDVEKINFNNEV